MRRALPRPMLVALLAAVFATGCGKDGPDPGKMIVTGKLVKGNEAYFLDLSKVKLPKGGHAMPPGVSGNSVLQVSLISMDTKERYEAETFPEAGTFKVAGPQGKGITPGRYKIVLVARVGFSPTDPDLFEGRYSDQKSQIIRDIKPGDDVVIDVDKPQG